MKLLQKKLKNKKGFTLIEMLVVIAIIAILVAISIPMVSGALEKAREAADDANLQAAKSVALLAEMEGATTGTRYYDTSNGTLVASKGTSTYGQSSDKKDKSITVEFDANGQITGTIDWK